MTKVPELYAKYFIEKNDERLKLFQILVNTYDIKKGLYPGSFVHVTPSLVIPDMVYIDSDKRCKKFFESEITRNYIEKKKQYSEPVKYLFYEADFTGDLRNLQPGSDLLISLYAGSISQFCGKYLKKDGILVANNSHGDAALAYLNPDYELIAVINRNGERFSSSNKNLESYFIPKSGAPINKEDVIKKMRGPAYTKSAYAYVFKKLNRWH